MRSIYSLVLLFVVFCHDTTVQAAPVSWLDSAMHYVETLFKRQAFIDFDSFIKGVHNSSYDGFATTAVQNQTAFEEMKQHVQAKNDNEKTTKDTTKNKEDDYCDCIQLMQQPSVFALGLSHIEDPPLFVPPADFGANGTEAANISSPAPSILTLGLHDSFGNPVSCPDDSVPVQRLTLEKLTQYPSLAAYNWKPPVHVLTDGRSPLSKREAGTDRRSLSPALIEARDPARPYHVHAFAWDSQANTGSNSWLDLWSPPAEFSISQQWVIANVTGQKLQTVEGGWIVYKQRWGTNARLFTIYTADDYGPHSCYNHDCGTFTQVNSHWYLGGPWDRYSVYGGLQWGFEMQWQLYQGNWWLFLRGPADYEAVGYYPNKVFLGGPLGAGATDVVFGGEVANLTSTPANHFGPMGSAHFSEEGWTRAAYQNRIFRIMRDPHGANFGVWAVLKPILQTWTSCFTMGVTPWQSGGNWGTYMYFGGPGGDNSWNGLGT